MDGSIDGRGVESIVGNKFGRARARARARSKKKIIIYCQAL